jgi:hypothetical protein
MYEIDGTQINTDLHISSIYSKCLIFVIELIFLVSSSKYCYNHHFPEFFHFSSESIIVLMVFQSVTHTMLKQSEVLSKNFMMLMLSLIVLMVL